MQIKLNHAKTRAFKQDTRWNNFHNILSWREEKPAPKRPYQTCQGEGVGVCESNLGSQSEIQDLMQFK